MIFEPLWKAAQEDELILTNGGMCHFHLRKDGQITIREIIVLPKKHRSGIGTNMLNIIKYRGKHWKATSIFAKVPSDLPANKWFEAMDFQIEGNERTKAGQLLTLWRLKL